MAEPKPTRKAKRFQPELVETSVKSSKAHRKEGCFAPGDDSYDNGNPQHADSPALSEHNQPRAEHSSHAAVPDIAGSSLGPSDGLQGGLNVESGQPRPPRRFVPQPVETVKSSRRQERDADTHESAKARRRRSSEPRRFTPQLIETAKRSFRHVEAARTRSFGIGSGPHGRGGARIAKDTELPTRPLHGLESRFSYTNLLQREQVRRHSFRVPDLPAIQSNSSEDSGGSGTPSLSTSPSAASDESLKRTSVMAPSRESCDERFSGHLVSIAARSVEKQLREQTLAAFPNEQIYQPPAHFAIDKEDEEDSDEDTTRDDRVDVPPNRRRESSVDLSWQLENMRQHKEEAEMRHRAMFATNALPRTPAATPVQRDSNHGMFPYTARVASGRRTNHIASPPMLGADLVFPQSLSPEGTACEGDHNGPQAEAKSEDACVKCGGLWCSTPRVTAADGGGLWMGTCRKEDVPPAMNVHLQPGLVTPKAVADCDSWLSLDEYLGRETGAHLPQDPSDGDSRLEDVDRKLSIEGQQGLSEFNDEFVTQIYDYLSLGYPCVARYFDEELSKISGISVGELRRDDLNTDAKGHVGVSDAVSAGKGVPQGSCMRWRALRSYIHEWVRQQPGMVDDDCNVETWGVRERRGSWAI